MVHIFKTQHICGKCGHGLMVDFCMHAEGSAGIDGDAECIVSECAHCGYSEVRVPGAEYLVQRARDEWRAGKVQAK